MEAFVYIWKNLTNGKQYIGYHKGNIDDGYICSSASKLFWDDFENPTMEWNREIVYIGTSNECLQYEQQLLQEADLKDPQWYNNARGANVIFTDEVREKIRVHHIGKPSGMLGKKHTEETKVKLSKALKNRVFTEEHLNKLRKPNKDSSAKRGPKSAEHKLAMKQAHLNLKPLECPHCGVSMRPCLAKRWHFDNCKRKV